MQKEATLIGLGRRMLHPSPQTAEEVLFQVVETEQVLRGLYKEVGTTFNW